MKTDLNILGIEKRQRAGTACVQRVEFAAGAVLLTGSLLAGAGLFRPDAAPNSLETFARLATDGLASLAGAVASISLIAVLLGLWRRAVASDAE